ncbi:MAG: MFS transporter [Thermomicrobiales bacterium]|nr:MFS transporter [Thermomicrobiales bacterium]MCO5225161.1 MFS transporter [Thermomicrobiales bacterium]MCO5229214.1 MFS transporter [Thermomicrobiales bacterium]
MSASNPANKLPGLRNLHYSWVMFGVVFIILLGASGFRSAPGVLMVPLQEAFGWDRGTISFAVSINLVLYGFMGPFAAALMERYPMRAVVSIALITISTGALLTLVMTKPLHLYLTWGVMVGLGSGSMATVLAATVVGRWFVAKRGLAMGALTAASATGQLIFLPIIAWQASVHGWQAVSITIATMALAVVPLAFIFLKDRPVDLGLTRLGAPEGDAVPPRSDNPVKVAWGTLALASRRSEFWILAITFFVCGATTNGLIGTHLIPAGHDHGMSEVSAANLLAIIGIFDVVGTIASGWLTDRYDPRKLLFGYYFLRGLSLMALTSVLGSVNFGLIAFIVFYGLDWVATVPPTVQLCQQIFGPGKGSVVYGWVFSAHQVGAALIAWLAGVSRTITGDYVTAFTTAGAMAIIAAGMILLIRIPKPATNVIASVAAGD